MENNQIFKELQDEYNKSIPEKLKKIDLLIAELEKSKSSDALTNLRREVHKLAGNTGTYGYLDASILCKHMELKLMQSPIDNSLFQALHGFQNELKTALIVVGPKKIETSQQKVLLLEEDPNMLAFMEKALQEIGLDVHTLTDKNLLIETLEAFSPDILILNVYFPELRGIEILSMLRNDLRFANLGIILTSAFPQKEIIAKAEELGANAFLTKPFSRNVLQSVVERTLKRKQVSSATYQTVLSFDQPPVKKTVGKLVIIIDDDEDLVRILKYGLHSIGLKSIEIHRGKDAIEYLESKAVSDNVSLFVLDRLLPDMDGMDILRKIHEVFKADLPPVIILSALSAEKDMIEGFEQGAVDYITKPFSITLFLQKVRTYVSI